MSAITEILARFKLNVLAIDGVPESHSSEVYKLTLSNREVVYVKIPFNKDKLFREYHMLQLLEGFVPVPKVLNFWEGNDEITGALLLSNIEGIHSSSDVDSELAYQIGMHHASLHEVKLPGYGFHTQEGFQLLEQGDWRLHIRNNFESLKEHCHLILAPQLYERCLAYFDHAYGALPQADGPCAVHMDLRPGNILVHNGKVSGFIDFESARGGASEIDFTKMITYFSDIDPSLRKSYTTGYKSVRTMVDVDLVYPFYKFYDAFMAISWCKRRGIDKNRDFLQGSISTLEQLVGS